MSEVVARYRSGPRKGQTIYCSEATAAKLGDAVEVLGTVAEVAAATRAVRLGAAGEKGN